MVASIGGSVIQRSYVGVETGNIAHIATVPLKELSFDEENFELSLAALLGAPVSVVLADHEYEFIIAHLGRGFQDTVLPDEIGRSRSLFSDFLLTLTQPSFLRSLPFLYYDRSWPPRKTKNMLWHGTASRRGFRCLGLNPVFKPKDTSPSS